ncbi:hypothetical protein GLAREA_11424 [Glarea lozoyensis ATCC 20868]|uniref:Uncharacterized protein n=1 Tax=Glarea lozoyensis (strain ATCC 20868 / MF5171) TaxID=1116229 RepID=S3DDY2_GLAL2|nr:uncharacterized protein GLAREA_11424 [Glarea lozoyensis ATCC 20868]EPE24843.1 hypothetical protein GLAREA_11424 [Glarea lozoyensis ATCC 20868]
MQGPAGSFYIDVNGPFDYILENHAPGETRFPLLCHGEIGSENNPDGPGNNSPVRFTFFSNAAQAAKTISQSQNLTSDTVSTTLVGSSMTETTKGVSANTTSISTSSVLLSSASPSNTPAVSTRTSSESSSTSSYVSPPSPTPINTGAIVGGIIGGMALLSSVVVALLFLQKYRHNNADISPASIATTTEPTQPIFNLFTSRQNRNGKLGIVGVQEGNDITHPHPVNEVSGTGLTSKPPGRLSHDFDAIAIGN